MGGPARVVTLRLIDSQRLSLNSANSWKNAHIEAYRPFPVAAPTAFSSLPSTGFYPFGSLPSDFEQQGPIYRHNYAADVSDEGVSSLLRIVLARGLMDDDFLKEMCMGAGPLCRRFVSSLVYFFLFSSLCFAQQTYVRPVGQCRWTTARGSG